LKANVEGEGEGKGEDEDAGKALLIRIQNVLASNLVPENICDFPQNRQILSNSPYNSSLYNLNTRNCVVQ
jgi:hypothetical protein